MPNDATGTRRLETRCCISGGGPAGLMLGLLLARAGVDTIVLEKHADFLRDFRGDTIHPSTMTVLQELGLLEAFLRLPHQKVTQLSARFGDAQLGFADFSHLKVPAPFVAMMPQWDFLDFIADAAQRYGTFRLLMRSPARALIEQDGRVVGVRASDAEGDLEIAADLVVAADGRHSILRAQSGLRSIALGAPMDVLWFALPRGRDDTDETQARFGAGRIFIMLNRGDYWQCAFVIPKGGDAPLRAAGIDAFRRTLAPLLPFRASRLEALGDFDQVKLLSVRVDRLAQWWRPGFLCIGDAAHAMSPIAGVGVNLAVQDAVAAANLLAAPLRARRLRDKDLAAVQRRRDFPTRVTQRLQLLMQNRVIAPTLAATAAPRAPLALRLLSMVPILRRLPARLIGIGVRPEHVAPRA